MSNLRNLTLCSALFALAAPAYAIGPVEQQFNACLHKSSGDCPTIGDVVAERQAAVAPVITPEEVEIVIPEVVASCTARPWFQRDAQWECSAPVTPWNGGVIRGPSADNGDPEAEEVEEKATLDVDNGDQKEEDTTEADNDTVIEEDEVEEVEEVEEEVEEEQISKERAYRDHKKRSRRHEARKHRRDRKHGKRGHRGHKHKG